MLRQYGFNANVLSINIIVSNLCHRESRSVKFTLLDLYLTLKHLISLLKIVRFYFTRIFSDANKHVFSRTLNIQN